ncbi:hypothetical protein BDZ89DRAFT_340685 [Hymenopellis radicata]|nr:hypothetical protein BDZ89DRAFT_340685 [Hymenopellis radicata]
MKSSTCQCQTRRLRPFQNTSHSTPSYLNDIVSVRSHYSLWIGGRNLSWGLSIRHCQYS